MANLLEWMGQVHIVHKNATKQTYELKSELQLAQQRLLQLEQKCKASSKDEFDLREKEQYLATEVGTLREKLYNRDEEKKEIYLREEKMQRQN